MTRADNTLADMRANPRDWRITNLEAVAAALSVPVRRPIKPIYVRRFVRLIETVRGDDG